VSYCKNYGDATYPGHCLGTPDPRYTMDFTDVEPGAFIYWCANCGPGAHAIDAAIQKALRSREGFYEEFRDAIEAAEAEQREAAQ
jgi:hypothetical protein